VLIDIIWLQGKATRVLPLTRFYSTLLEFILKIKIVDTIETGFGGVPGLPSALCLSGCSGEEAFLSAV
jgi:hypothetical protein